MRPVTRDEPVLHVPGRGGRVARGAVGLEAADVCVGEGVLDGVGAGVYCGGIPGGESGLGGWCVHCTGEEGGRRWDGRGSGTGDVPMVGAGSERDESEACHFGAGT